MFSGGWPVMSFGHGTTGWQENCGPSLSLLNQNALSYADEVIIPVTCDYMALVGAFGIVVGAVWL